MFEKRVIKFKSKIEKSIFCNIRIDYYIQRLTEEENKLFKIILDNIKTEDDKKLFYEKYSINPENIISSGSTDNVSKSILAEIIDKIVYSTRTNAFRLSDGCITVNTTRYECFGIPDWKTCHTNIHLDLKSSWNGLMYICNKPKYVFIYTKKTKIDEK